MRHKATLMKVQGNDMGRYHFWRFITRSNLDSLLSYFCVISII